VTRLVGAELLKLRTTRTFWALAGSAAALVLMLLVLTLSIDNTLDTAEDARSVFGLTALCGLLTLVFGVVAGAGEYRHGTIATTLLVTPQRLRAVSATVMGALLAGLAIGLGVSAVTAVIALPWLSAKDVVMPSAGSALEVFLGGCLYAALAAAFGAALGALMRNQVVAVVIVLVQLFVVDPTLAALVEDLGKFTLTGLGIGMAGAGENDQALPRGVAAVVWALYTVLVTALAVIVTARRDI
jgi:ABC-2 type transport system permease protein